MKRSQEPADQQLLASNVHDELGPLVSLLKLQLQALGDKALPHQPMLQPDLTALQNTADLLANRIRSLVNPTQAGVDARIDPVHTLAHFCASIDRTGKAGITFYQQGVSGPFTGEFAGHLLRMAYELINNALRHSNAKQISVQIVQEGARLSLSVEDDGIGFDWDPTDDSRSGMGLNNIRERSTQFGGVFTIETRPGHGVFINIEFDLAKTPPGGRKTYFLSSTNY